VEVSPKMRSLFILDKLWPITNSKRCWNLGNLCDALRVHKKEYPNRVAFKEAQGLVQRVVEDTHNT
jgi:hypothetical protein